MSPTKLIFAAVLFTKDQGCNSVGDFKPCLDTLFEIKHLVSEINTSAMYQQSEEYLGQLNFGSQFAIETKLPGQFGPPATKETVIAQAKASLSKLGVYKVRRCTSFSVPILFVSLSNGYMCSHFPLGRHPLHACTGHPRPVG